MPVPSTTSASSIRALLSDLGVEIRQRRHEWHECLLIAGDGSWLGYGGDEEAALWQAVCLAFPAGPARSLFLRSAAHMPVAAEIRAPASAVAPGPDAAPSAPPAAPSAPDLAPPAPAPPQAAASADDDAAREPALPMPERAPAPTPPAAAASADDDGAREPALPEPEPGPAPTPPPAAASAHDDGARDDPAAALRDLVSRIERDCGALAHAAPSRQRLVLLGWLAVARSWQDVAAGDTHVASMVPEIVRRLRVCTDAWWPGTISAFQRDAWPENSLRDLPDHPSGPPRTWDAVARSAAEALERLEDREHAAGLDHDGWADATCILPLPDNPDRMLADLIRELEQHGSLTQRQPKHLPTPDPSLLLRWARQARWLRGATDEGSSWGAVMGRLRYWCQSPAAGEARRTLDPAYRPPATWSALVRSMTEAVRTETTLRELLDKAPNEGTGEAQRLSWIRRSLPHTTNHHDEIVAAITPLGPWIVELTAEDLGITDKRLRRRLRKLQASFLPDEVGEDDDDGEQEELQSEAPGRVCAVPDAIRSETRGKQVLFVSNRADPQLQERLVDDFDFGALDWAEATPRRIDAAVEKIASGSFEMVLGATGFLSHKEDFRLANACKLVGIPYVRVNKGRPGAVTLALQRELPSAVA